MATVITITNQSMPAGETLFPAGGPAAPRTVPAGVRSVDVVFAAGPMPRATQFFDGQLYLDRGDGNGFVPVAGITGPGGSFPPNKDGSGTPVAQTLTVTEHVVCAAGQRYYADVKITDGPVTLSGTVTENTTL